jgi:hypothetical protein
MWRRRNHSENTDSVVLASVRMLEGNAAELFRESGQGVPAWAYLNALAHSQADQLTTLTTAPLFLRPGGWDAVVAYLATELLTIAHGRPDQISVIQRAALVPLELGLLAGEVPEPEIPGQLAELVIDALHRGPSRDRHA